MTLKTEKGEEMDRKTLEKMKKDSYFMSHLKKIEKESRLSETKNHIQHGNTSVYYHCLYVSYMSYRTARLLKLKVSYSEVIRGALLHDYFLYDWHTPDPSHRLHGFFHSKKALKNALEDFSLTKKEQDIIKKHMFPLTIKPPIYKESILVCVVDKACSGKEILKMFFCNRFA